MKTGFIGLDTLIGGFNGGELIILAGRPGMGKTSFLLNIAKHAIRVERLATAFFTLEMTKKQLIERYQHGDVDMDILVLANAPLLICDDANISIMEICAECWRLSEQNLGLVIIDYLQLMSGTTDAQSRSRGAVVSEVLHSLKELAKAVNVPVVVSSQISRSAEARDDRRPTLGDLHDVSSVAEIADVVAFLYRDDYYNQDTQRKNHTELIIDKNRFGSTVTVELSFNGEYGNFANENG